MNKLTWVCDLISDGLPANIQLTTKRQPYWELHILLCRHWVHCMAMLSNIGEILEVHIWMWKARCPTLLSQWHVLWTPLDRLFWLHTGASLGNLSGIVDNTLCWRWIFKIMGIAGCVLLPFLFGTLYGSDNRKPTRGSEGANTVKGQESQDLIWRKKKQLTLKVRIKFRCTCTASQDPYPSPHPSSWCMHTSIKSVHRMKRGLRMILSIMQYIGMKLGWLFGILSTAKCVVGIQGIDICQITGILVKETNHGSCGMYWLN